MDLLSLVLCGVKVIDRASTLELRVGALESTLSSSNARNGKVELQIASKCSKLDTDGTKL